VVTLALHFLTFHVLLAGQSVGGLGSLAAGNFRCTHSVSDAVKHTHAAKLYTHIHTHTHTRTHTHTHTHTHQLMLLYRADLEKDYVNGLHKLTKKARKATKRCTG